jgi:hypothetical protein
MSDLTIEGGTIGDIPTKGMILRTNGRTRALNRRAKLEQPRRLASLATLGSSEEGDAMPSID